MSIRKGMISGFLANSLGLMTQFVTSAIVARHLGPKELGAFVVCMSILIILQALREFGASQFVLKETDLPNEKIRSVLSICLIISWGLGALLLVSRSQIAELFSQPEIAGIVVWLSASFIPLPFSQLSLALLRRDRRYSELAVCSLFGVLVGSFVTIVAVVSEHGVVSLAYGVLATALTTSIVGCSRRSLASYLMPSLSGWRDIVPFGARASLVALLPSIGLSLPDMALAKIISVEDAALYNRGSYLARMLDRLLLSTQFTVIGAEFAKCNRSGESSRPLAMRATGIMLAAIWPLLAFLSVNSHDVLLVLYGERWVGVAPVLSILCLWRGISLLAVCAPSYYEGYGAINLQLRNEVFLQFSSIGLTIAAVSFGLLAVAWSRVPLAVVAVLVHASVLKAYGKISVGDLMRLGFIPGLASLLVAVLVTISGYAIPSTSNTISTVIMLCSEGLSCVAIVGCFYWLTMPSTLKDMLSFLKRT